MRALIIVIGTVMTFSLICAGCDRGDTGTTTEQQQQPPPAPPPDTPEGKAREKIDHVRELILEQKFPEAEKEIAELQKTKSSLPPEMQMEIENVQANMLAAKQTALENQPRPEGQPR